MLVSCRRWRRERRIHLKMGLVLCIKWWWHGRWGGSRPSHGVSVVIRIDSRFALELMAVLGTHHLLASLAVGAYRYRCCAAARGTSTAVGSTVRSTGNARASTAIAAAVDAIAQLVAASRDTSCATCTRSTLEDRLRALGKHLMLDAYNPMTASSITHKCPRSNADHRHSVTNM